MSNTGGARGVQAPLATRRVNDGAGVAINRVMLDQRSVDPFLMIDEIRSDNRDDFAAGFPAHPHRGFETITYMRQGAFSHRDSLGNEGRIAAGGVQWMTAGRGIIHSEMPEPDAQSLHGFQIWLNLPAADKLRTPEYRDIAPDEIPVVEQPGASVRVVGGTSHGVTGPLAGRQTAPHFFDITLDAGGHFEAPLDEALNVTLYVHTGSVEVTGTRIEARSGALLGPGSSVSLGSTEGGGALLLGGIPIGEPIAQAGPFVMNTRAELQQAYADYQSGRFQAEPVMTGKAD